MIHEGIVCISFTWMLRWTVQGVLAWKESWIFLYGACNVRNILVCMHSMVALTSIGAYMILQPPIFALCILVRYLLELIVFGLVFLAINFTFILMQKFLRNKISTLSSRMGYFALTGFTFPLTIRSWRYLSLASTWHDKHLFYIADSLNFNRDIFHAIYI